MKCYCGGTVVPKILEKYKVICAGEPIEFQGVPAEVCPKCGKTYFTEEVSLMIEGILKARESNKIIFPSPDELSTEEIKHIREKINLSQSRLAHLLGVTPNTVALWKQGRRSPVGPARVLLRMMLSTKMARENQGNSLAANKKAS